ncbi:predicted protein [Streptomyces sp. C]|nr:predicted protein [Streptomyces sp. C]
MAPAAQGRGWSWQPGMFLPQARNHVYRVFAASMLHIIARPAPVRVPRPAFGSGTKPVPAFHRQGAEGSRSLE